ncbi:hypothetical protein VP01_1146g2 [Puccinia sorghi]|uniref:Uncharacterized protein n=1 Tax=Puccinia sorghi TaxID=27349 RepID=A0A0L6VRT8_9BASI|nr:hypothetical protein VP01_1146g2 [Puccinia sorghi]
MLCLGLGDGLNPAALCGFQKKMTRYSCVFKLCFHYYKENYDFMACNVYSGNTFQLWLKEAIATQSLHGHTLNWGCGMIRSSFLILESIKQGCSHRSQKKPQLMAWSTRKAEAGQSKKRKQRSNSVVLQEEEGIITTGGSYITRGGIYIITRGGRNHYVLGKDCMVCVVALGVLKLEGGDINSKGMVEGSMGGEAQTPNPGWKIVHLGFHSLYCIVNGMFGGRVWTVQQYMQRLSGLHSLYCIVNGIFGWQDVDSTAIYASGCRVFTALVQLHMEESGLWLGQYGNRYLRLCSGYFVYKGLLTAFTTRITVVVGYQQVVVIEYRQLIINKFCSSGISISNSLEC